MTRASDIAKTAEDVLYAGLSEATGAYKEELRAFVEEWGAIIADTAIRATAGDKDAVNTLELLREQALTHEFIARRAAARASDVQIKQAIGTAIRFVINVLA